MFLIYQVEEQTAELLALTEEWFNNTKEKPIDALLTVCDQPFLQIRSAGLQCLATLCSLPWAQSRLNAHPGFNEYLLNRATENTKEGKEGKYDIVKTLVESPTTAQIFGQPYFVRLKVYEREGPFYVQAEAAVAIEEAA